MGNLGHRFGEEGSTLFVLTEVYKGLQETPCFNGGQPLMTEVPNTLRRDFSTVD